MSGESLARIDSLIDRVREAVGSERNRARGQTRPTAIFGIEEPIAWSHIFGYDVNRYFSDPYFYCEQTLRQKLWRWENFPDDDAPITLEIPAWLGHYPEYTLLGLDVSFNYRGVPRIQTDHPYSRQPDLRHFQSIDFRSSGWMPRILRWYDELDRIADGRLKVVFKMVWWRGCLDLAIQLRGYENFVMDTVERPNTVHDLLKFLAEQRCRWWEAYYRYFDLEVQPTAVADDWINVPFITPSMFADFVLPRYLEIEQYHGGITSVHSCGNQTPVQRHLLAIKSLPGLEVSPWTDLAQTLANVPPDKHLGISLHPNDVLCATADEMEEKLRGIVQSCNGRSYSIGTSGLTPITGDINHYVHQIRTWTAAAQKVKQSLPKFQ